MEESQPVYLSLGSNLGDRRDNLRTAIEALRPGVRIDAVSSLYETEPIGIPDQPPFLNLAVAGRTRLAPAELLALVKQVELDVGRKPTYRWGPRVVDIDILLYGLQTMHEPDLIIPHSEMHRRAFVLVPLAEIAPSVVHPELGLTAAQLRDSTSHEGVRFYSRYGADR